MIETMKKHRGKVFLFINYCYILIACTQLGIYLTVLIEKMNSAADAPAPIAPNLMGSLLALIFPWVFLMSAKNVNRNEPGAIDEKTFNRLKLTSVICTIASVISIVLYVVFMSI